VVNTSSNIECQPSVYRCIPRTIYWTDLDSGHSPWFGLRDF